MPQRAHEREKTVSRRNPGERASVPQFTLASLVAAAASRLRHRRLPAGPLQPPHARPDQVHLQQTVIPNKPGLNNCTLARRQRTGARLRLTLFRGNRVIYEVFLTYPSGITDSNLTLRESSSVTPAKRGGKHIGSISSSGLF